VCVGKGLIDREGDGMEEGMGMWVGGPWGRVGQSV